MGRTRRKPTLARPPEPVARGAAARRWLPIGAVAVALGGAGLVLLLVRRAPEPPAVSTDGLDPAVVALIETTTRDVRAQPRSGAAWGRLATVLMHAECRADAGSAFRQAEKLTPQDARWPYLHGLMLREGDPESALTRLGEASRLCRDEPDGPRLRLAQLLSERGGVAEAEHHFQALLQRYPSHPPAQLGMARVRLAEDRPAESAQWLGRCAEDPHVARSALTLLAQVRRRQGDAVGAEAATRKASALPPDRPWPDPYWSEALRLRVGRVARLEQAQTLIDHGRVADALELLRSLAREYPAEGETHYLMGWALNREGRGAEAERSLREHLARSPGSPKGHAQLAVALLAQERHAEAMDVLERAILLAPTWSELHFNLGYAYAGLGRPRDAIARFRETLRLDPGYVDAYITLADLVSRTGEREEPLVLLDQALQLNPGDDRARFLLQRISETR